MTFYRQSSIVKWKAAKQGNSKAARIVPAEEGAPKIPLPETLCTSYSSRVISTSQSHRWTAGAIADCVFWTAVPLSVRFPLSWKFCRKDGAKWVLSSSNPMEVGLKKWKMSRDLRHLGTKKQVMSMKAVRGATKKRVLIETKTTAIIGDHQPSLIVF